MADKNVSIDITASDRTKAAFDSVKKGLGEIGGSVETMKGVFSGFAALAASAGITDLFKEAVAAASKAEQSSNRLNAVIRATGDVSGFTRGELDKMAEALTKATTFDDEGIRDAQANLLKFGHLHGETFERALKLSADYAAFTGGSMVEATQLIGKALADPVNGVTALGKAMGKLSETQREAIDKFMSLGQVASAQEVIFKKLETSIGGTAGAMNSGLYGATTSATKAWDDMLKALGKTAPVQVTTTGVLYLLTQGLSGVTDAILKQNAAFDKNPLYNGKLNALPESVIGKGGLQPSIVPPGMNEMTIEEVNAKGRGRAAAGQEAAAAAAEARKKLLKEFTPLADELAREYAEADIKQKEAARDVLSTFLEEQIKERKDYEKLAEELGKEGLAAEISQRQAATEMMFAYNEEQRRRFGVLNDQEAQDRLIQIMDSMRSEREIEDQDWIEKQQILQARYESDWQLRSLWRAKLLQLDRTHLKNVTAIEDAEIKKRYGINQVYRKADIDSALFFANQLAGLMQTKHRALFEVGKAAAIVGAIIDTYKAATGSYAALAPIPIVGPALGAAAATAAVLIGMARVAAIKSTNFGTTNGGAVGTFAASPNTGLPEAPISPAVEPVGSSAPGIQAAQRSEKLITVQILGEGMFSAAQIRDSLIPLLNDAVGDGVTLRATAI